MTPLFVIDFGRELLAEGSGSPPLLLGRYSVWAEDEEGRQFVIREAQTLDELLEFSRLPIVKLPVPGARTGQGE